MIANAHIDPVWLWVWQDGLEVARSTCLDAVDLLRKYPRYTFTRSSAAVYRWIEQTDPDLFEEITRLVKEDRWNIVNGWWVQPDCNIPCGESLVRQGLYGQLYFEEKFGKRAKVGFNVDTFGHCISLPQILRKCGLNSYVFHRPGSHEKKLSNDLFNWESPDGSRVLAARIDGYGAGSMEDLEKKLSKARERSRKSGMDTMCFYGHGDHGGGPVEEMVQEIQELSETREDASIEFSTPERFFDSVWDASEELPVLQDELQHHSRGCYTVVSEIKRMNRELEILLLNAEKFCALCSLLYGAEYPREILRESWHTLLFHQFHDVLAGTSIRPAYDDAMNRLKAAQIAARSRMEMAIETLSSRINTAAREGHQILVINPAYYEREDQIEFQETLDTDSGLKVIDDEDRIHEVQVLSSREIEGRKRVRGIFTAELPPAGYRVFWIRKGDAVKKSGLETPDTRISNSRYLLKVDPQTGFLTSIVEVESGREYLNGPCRPLILRDESDTWSHDVDGYRDEIGSFQMRGSPRVKSGQVRSLITTDFKYEDSSLTLKYELNGDSPVIYCRMDLDWHEKHKMLKMSIPIATSRPRALYEVPYATVERPTNGEEEPGQRWVDVIGSGDDGSEKSLLVLNDSKYGFDVLDSEIRVSIVRSPVYAFHRPRKVDPDKTYLYTDQGKHELDLGLVPHGRMEIYTKFSLAEAFNNRPFLAFSNKHQGELPTSASLISAEPRNLAITAFKISERDERGIVRVFESSGQKTSGMIRLPLIDVKIPVQLDPWEVKTYAFSPDGVQAENNMLEIDISESEKKLYSPRPGNN